MTTSGTTEIDHYLAGVFDGEGCVHAGIHRKDSTAYITVQVMMTDRESVDIFYERFGGALREQSRKGYYKTIYCWTVNGGGAVEALEVLSRLCRVKKEVCEWGLLIAKSMRENKSGFVGCIDEKESRLENILKIRAKIGRTTVDPVVIQKYLSPKFNGDVAVQNSLGQIYPSMKAAGAAYGVTGSAIGIAVRKGKKSCGMSWNKVSAK